MPKENGEKDYIQTHSTQHAYATVVTVQGSGNQHIQICTEFEHLFDYILYTFQTTPLPNFIHTQIPNAFSLL